MQARLMLPGSIQLICCGLEWNAAQKVCADFGRLCAILPGVAGSKRFGSCANPTTFALFAKQERMQLFRITPDSRFCPPKAANKYEICEKIFSTKNHNFMFTVSKQI